MCYSKEVSLVVAGILIIAAFFLWYFYVHKQKKEHLVNFFRYTILAYLCIAGHQLFEFISIATGNDIIYRLGLIISISTMYFLMKSLESLTGYDFKSWILIPVIAVLGVYLFTIPMVWEDVRFWVSGYSHSVWAVAWMGLFMFWNACVFYVVKKTKKGAKKKALEEYALDSLDISFILAFLYFTLFLLGSGYSAYQDSPSIWCVFFVVQVIFAPHLAVVVTRNFSKKPKQKKVSWKVWIILVVLVVLLLTVLTLLMPYYSDLATKFVFR